MEDSRRELLRNAIGNAFQEMGFMFIDDPEESNCHVYPETSYYQVSMNYKGPENGQLSLAVPTGLARELAGNILGEMDDDCLSAELCEDGLKEVLNVICGEVVADLYGKHEVVNLTIPTITEMDSTMIEKQQTDSGMMTLSVEQEVILSGLKQLDS
jgi:hypothetical protein